MFSKPLTMVLVALSVGLAGFVAAEPIPAASCPNGQSEYCCFNPNTADLTLNCRPYQDLQSCTGVPLCCGPEGESGYKCGLLPTGR